MLVEPSLRFHDRHVILPTPGVPIQQVPRARDVQPDIIEDRLWREGHSQAHMNEMEVFDVVDEVVVQYFAHVLREVEVGKLLVCAIACSHWHWHHRRDRRDHYLLPKMIMETYRACTNSKGRSRRP
jgi:hypothetical protein